MHKRLVSCPDPTYRYAREGIYKNLKGGTGNEEMGNGEIRKRRNKLEMVVKST